MGDSPGRMRLGEDGNIVSSINSAAILEDNKGSAARKGEEIFVGRGWTTDTLSLFGEFNHQLRDDMKVIVSARFDRSSYIDWLSSPRVVHLWELGRGKNLKTIVQQSVR